MTPIAERPAEVATRPVPGHWEGDLIKGARNGSAVGTLVERTTRLGILARMDGMDARSAARASPKKLLPVPALLRKTVTYDRGKEMAEHERLAERLATGGSLPIRTARGNGAPTRTRMGGCASTGPRGPTCRATRSASCMPSPIA